MNLYRDRGTTAGIPARSAVHGLMQAPETHAAPQTIYRELEHKRRRHRISPSRFDDPPAHPDLIF